LKQSGIRHTTLTLGRKLCSISVEIF
jgi:hypothetical protein